jgi:hypothetical protein
MSKVFTHDDVLEVTKASYLIGIEAVWCNILFKGCTNPAEFYASPHANNDFAKDMYNRLQNGEYGELTHGLGEYRTQPKEQSEVEADVIAKRNQLLLESDWTDNAPAQARFSDTVKSAWSAYRQSLRDITTQPSFPWDPIWPTTP